MNRMTRSMSLFGLAMALGVAAGLASVDDSNKEFKGDPYTLDVCVVMNKKLGSMGEPVVKSYDGREVRFCCESCVPKFEADPQTYWKRIDALLIEQQTAHYPLTHCVVMESDSLEGVDDPDSQVVYRNRLVRFCCFGCVGKFEKEPAKYIAKLDAAVIKQQSEKYPLTTCPVSGEKLGSMGEPVQRVVGTTLVKFCCAACEKSFEKDPLPVIAKVHDAWKAMHKDAGH